MAKTRRTTHRSAAGKKLYAVRDSKGRFKDIQTYERAHRADLAKTSGEEKTARTGKTTTKKGAKTTAKKTTKRIAKKTARKTTKKA